MKKIFAYIMTVIYFCIFIPDSYAASDCRVISKEVWDQKYYQYNGMRLTYSANRINNFWYTGKEYIYRDLDDNGNTRFRCSEDTVNWTVMPLTSGLIELNRHSAYTYSINYWNGKYVVFNRLHEWSSESISEAEHNATVNSPLLIMDKDFNLIGEQLFESPVTAVSYVDGVYYAETKDYSGYKASDAFEPQKKVYISTDAISWEESGHLTEAPLGDGKSKSLIFTGSLLNGEKKYAEKICYLSDNIVSKSETPVIFEKEQSRYFKMVDNIYISWSAFETGSKSFQISLDGVYWMDIAYPALQTAHDIHPETESESVVESVYDCIGLKDKILFQTQYRLFEYDFNELQAEWEQLCNSKMYVMFEGKYLGFETPPVIEDGRTLVPARFILEQMGAEVEWNGETRTVTAIKEGMAVALAIDNANATVNGSTVTLDVPARLINDKTMIPLRFLSENLGYTADWNADSRTAVIEEPQ